MKEFEAHSSRTRVEGAIIVTVLYPQREKANALRTAHTAASDFYTIGRKRPTTSCKRPVIWPNEQTSAASSRAVKTFSPRSETVASLSNACFAFSPFFFLNF